MTQTELICADSAIAPPSQQAETRRAADARGVGERRRNARLGLLIVLTTATVFYSAIAVCIWKLL